MIEIIPQKQLIGEYPNQELNPEYEWQSTNAALVAIGKLFDVLDDQKPDKKKQPQAFTVWEMQHREVEKWAQAIGARRFACVIKEKK